MSSNRFRRARSSFLLVAATLIPAGLQRPAPPFDVILRHGTIVDGTGRPPYVADIGIRGGSIARIGSLSAEHGTTELDVRGLLVAPGFINVHSHAMPAALPTAANMLSQGVTTEIINADGGGPLDIGQQLETLERGGLAVNIGASIGFNSIWQDVVGRSDRRPDAGEIERMQQMVVANLERGAFGVSAGLDYKPAYFATVDEVVRVLEPARRWRTYFPNHDRSTPETGYSSRAGITETITIGERAGLVPEITHMKIQGHEQGTAAAVLAMMRSKGDSGVWVPADVYPYLAGQTGLAALIIPGWAQAGGIDSLRARLRDPALRARIVTESDEAIRARFNGPESILVTGTRKLSDIMREQGVSSPGAAIAKILETETPWAILGFGIEADLVKLLQYPSAAIACDCGAATGSRGHPRYYGNFPRVLGRYVRETHALTWPDAIRKMSGLPASIVGLVDRGLIAPGMAADITVFDSATVIDHATFEVPDAPPEGIRHVLVNGTIALRDGKPTGNRGGRALRRTAHMPSRPMVTEGTRQVTATGALTLDGDAGSARATIALQQVPDERRAVGTIRLTIPRTATRIESVMLGDLQIGPRWASVTGIARVRPPGQERAFTLIVEEADPMVEGAPSTIALTLEGMAPIIGRFDRAKAKIAPEVRERP